MSRMQPFRPLLRAFAAPRPFFSARYSTAAPSAPPNSQRAADLASVEALTESDSAQPGAADPLRPQHSAPASKSKNLKTAAATQKAKTVPFTPATQPQIPLDPPQYHVARSTNKNLPVYQDYKRGGNLHLTSVRKISGDLHALRDELRTYLSKKEGEVTINSLTQQVVVKGHHREEINEFLKARGM